MPITVPRASVTQSADDLMARDMVLCRFPEIDMVMGKAGRAETATDPAPMDMIESMVSFRPPELWPKRRLRAADAERQTRAVLTALVGKQLIEPPPDRSAFDALVSDATSAAQSSFDAVMREVAWHKNEEFGERLGRQPTQHRALWRGHLEKLNDELLDRAPATYTRLVTDELLARATVTDAKLDAILEEQRRQRQQPATTRTVRAGHHGSRPAVPVVMPDPHPVLDSLRIELAEKFRRWLILWPQDRAELIGFGGELDRALQMPGWTNVWTMPIQNRVDMLATGVNTAIGVRLLGRDLDDVVRASEDVAAELRLIPGAADVVADPIRGKGYLEIRPDRTRIAHYGLNVADVNEVVETTVAGKVATTTVQGRERHPVRVRLTRDWREDEETVRNLLVPVEEIRTNLDQLTGVELGADPVDEVASPLSPVIPLSEIADVRITEGPATIKSENGLLRNYVRLNVRGRGVVDFVEEARRVVAQKVKLPAGVYLEWTGQFEHHVRARNRLVLLVPLVIGLILLILYLTYRDWADAVLMLLTVPGAMVGGVLFQWLFGFKFSVTVWVGYIACFGMATATGIIMLVYLREAIEKAGGLAHITLDELRQAVLNGAVQRLRPKLLTEGTTMIGLAPMLWATGTGAEVIRPMAAPVLGGILVADEVIDLLLPVLFYWVRHWRWLQLHTKPLGLMDDGQEPLRVLPEQRAMPAVAGLPTDQTSSIVLDIGNQPEFG
ncbi:MAG: efflux RND transporter permease subunit [Planctomycetes bacterium]|nr:efflux RND transporter permease subunit [Planctomycetota bacterium]